MNDLQNLIGNTLRWGVTIACVLAAFGGTLYVMNHGLEPLPDYTRFSYATAAQHTEYTTFSGILHGLTERNALSWIQLGVVALLLTPIVRVVLSLVDFAKQRDWLYTAITAIVLAIIIANSLSGK